MWYAKYLNKVEKKNYLYGRENENPAGKTEFLHTICLWWHDS